MTDEDCAMCPEHTMLSPKMVAEYVGVDRETVYRWMNSGVEVNGETKYLQAAYFGPNQIRISKQDIDDFKVDYKEARNGN